jgi:hypothetical protein
VPVPVMEIGAVGVRVLGRVVQMGMAVRSEHRGGVRVRVVSVIVPMRVLVLDRHVPVSMVMPLRDVQVDGHAEEHSGERNE